MTTTYNAPFMQKPDAGFRLGDIRAIWDAIVNSNAVSTAYGIAAAGTTQATGIALTSVFNQVDTVGSSSGVLLPSSRGVRSSPFNYCVIVNNGANALQVYAAVPASGTADTINGTAGATGISIPTATIATFISAKPGVWFSDQGTGNSFGAITVAGNITETSVGSGFVQKTGTNGRAGTFSLNGATTVTVTNTSVAASDFIGISLNTAAGTVGVYPHITSVSAGQFFTIIGTASDTSLYNFSMIGVN